MNHKAIWKYHLQSVDVQQLRLPRGYTVLNVKLVGGTICLYALVTPANTADAVLSVVTVETGEKVGGDALDSYTYLDTVVMPALYHEPERPRDWVWHIYTRGY